VDATSDRPIQDAEVQILYSWGELVTALGIHLAPGQNLTVQLKLQPEAMELKGLTVLVEEIDWHLELAGFYNRQRGASGFFKEVSEWENRTATQASDYFRGARGIEVRGGVPLVTRAQQLQFWAFEDRGLLSQSQSGFDPVRGRDDEERNTAACGVFVVWTKRGQFGGE
jgi:hypothetical protein